MLFRSGGRAQLAGRLEPDHVLAADEVDELAPGALGLDLSLVDDADAVAEALGLLHVVRRVEHGHPLAREELDALEDRVARLRVHAHGGLVEDEQLGTVEQPDGDVQPSLHAAGVRARQRPGAVGEADELEYLVHAAAERLCDRVGIIDEGEVKAEGTRRELVDLVGGEDVVRLEATGELGQAATALEGLDGVRRVDVQAGTLQVVTTGAARLLPAIVERVAAAGGGVARVEVSEPDLESVFLHLTGKALRD